MRAPDDLPRRRARRARTGRGRALLIVGLVALFVLLTSLRGLAGFYTDYLWFDSLDMWGVRRGILSAQVSLAFIFIAAFFVLAWSNLYVAELVAPPFRPTGPEDELLERYHDLVAGRMGRVRLAVAGLLAVIAGSGASAEWNSWILFTNGGDFGVDDPQFGRDVGFYVFRLPFLSFVVDWLFASLLIVLIVTAVAHYLNGGIRVQPPSPRVSAQVKAHLSVLLAALALVKTADYWLQRFELTVSGRGVVDGASYTDVNAQLPALNLLVLISVAAAGLFIANIFLRGWTLPVVAVVLWGFVAVVIGGVYPQVVQRFQVQPQELSREGRYIERNIEATRAAMGMDEVRVEEFDLETDPDAVDLGANADTVRNIRLWDPRVDLSGRTFEQLQQVYPYYSINDVDVDRYMVDGDLTQVNLSTRDLEPDSVPGDSWENQHLAYTHGYGVVMAPSNATVEGEPEFTMRDIPAESVGGAPELSQRGAGIYFGEHVGGYAIVDTGRREIDFRPEGGEQEETSYQGEDGVRVGSIFRRAAFALRFGDLNPMISDYLNSDSRVIFNRDVRDRVETLAPFLHADGDPYPVVLDGRVTWVVDLYTTTDRYPYAQRADSDQVQDDSGLDHRFNYVRNSVKATVDAYDGTVNFYVMDPEDPILDAYRDAFPDLFDDRSDMPEGLEAHLRYPEDLFRVQTSAWERYHLSDPQDFFDQDQLWRVARDPLAEAGSGTPVTNEQGEPTGEVVADRIPPYYQLLRLPEEDQAEFVMMRPFVPFSQDDRRGQLASFMAVRMDPGSYGELVVYEMPPGERPDGPSIVANDIQSDRAVGREETLRGEAGSRVRYGNLLLIPVDNVLLYVQPFYVEAEEATRAAPRVEGVIAVVGDDVAFAPTLQEALTQLFGESPPTLEEPGETGDEPPTEPTEGEGGQAPAETGSAADLLAQAQGLFEEADQALADGDLGRYQELVEQAESLIQQAAEMLGEPGGGSGGGSGSGSGSGDGDAGAGDAGGSDSGGEATASSLLSDNTAAGGQESGGDGSGTDTPRAPTAATTTTTTTTRRSGSGPSVLVQPA